MRSDPRPNPCSHGVGPWNYQRFACCRLAVVLSEVRNYTRAAKKLGIHQPTPTKRILELEKLIGFDSLIAPRSS